MKEIYFIDSFHTFFALFQNPIQLFHTTLAIRLNQKLTKGGLIDYYLLNRNRSK